tara:strand:- start:824 stop:1942 length:1119 start_codon:yes stop_codon:yes gene_type:complete
MEEIFKMNDMKLLMESWRTYCHVEDKNLSLLKEQADKNLITEERLAELWFESLEQEWNQMVNEGVIDSLKAGMNAIRKGGKFIADKVAAMYEAAANKINEWITRLYIGGLDILERTIRKVVSFGPVQKFIGGMSALVDKVANFKEDHPVLHKIVMVAGIVAATAAVMYLMAGEANAKIQSPDNPKKIMTGAEDVWNGAKGICASIAKNTEDGEVRNMGMECIQMINDYAPGGAFDNADKVLKFSKDGVFKADDLVRAAADMFQGLEQDLAQTKKAGALIRDQWIEAGKPMEGPLYDKAMEAVNNFKNANNMVDDLLKMGEASTYKTQRLIKTATSQFQTVSGGIGAKDVADADTIQAVGKGAAQAVSKALGR